MLTLFGFCYRFINRAYKQERTFRHEIRKLADKPVNFAFVPMDPRLGPYQTLGIDFVLKNTDAELYDVYDLVDLFRNRTAASTNGAKAYYRYPRPYRWDLATQSVHTKNTLQILEWQTA